MSDHSTKEVEYREVDGFPGYRVGDDGSVWSKRKPGPGKELYKDWRRILPLKLKSGYMKVSLCNESGIFTRTVHQLILLSFGFSRPSTAHVTRHLNGVRDDNRLNNLKWGTQKENQDDRFLHGTACDGEKSSSAKLTRNDIVEIRNSRLSMKELSNKFNVSYGNIWAILSRRTWKHLT